MMPALFNLAVLICGILLAALGVMALAAANTVCEKHRREADAAKLDRAIARQERDEYHAALIWSRVKAATEHARRDFGTDDPTPMFTDLALARLRRDLDAFDRGEVDL